MVDLLKAHWTVLAVSDFLSVEIGTARVLATHYVLFVIRLSVVETRRIKMRPDEAWILQVVRI